MPGQQRACVTLGIRAILEYAQCHDYMKGALDHERNEVRGLFNWAPVFKISPRQRPRYHKNGRLSPETGGSGH